MRIDAKIDWGIWLASYCTMRNRPKRQSVFYGRFGAPSPVLLAWTSNNSTGPMSDRSINMPTTLSTQDARDITFIERTSELLRKWLPTTNPWTTERVSRSLTSFPWSIFAAKGTSFLLTPCLNKAWRTGFSPLTKQTHARNILRIFLSAERTFSLGESQPLNYNNRTDPKTRAKASILCINPLIRESVHGTRQEWRTTGFYILRNKNYSFKCSGASRSSATLPRMPNFTGCFEAALISRTPTKLTCSRRPNNVGTSRKGVVSGIAGPRQARCSLNFVGLLQQPLRSRRTAFGSTLKACTEPEEKLFVNDPFNELVEIF
ncbi:hypothetical protein CLF_100375 [Clonorchis sinensis]|uniref:Uncharacterized protein n=1 Tax=Clonorchis sinensis TaxID=79923 RepID=G7Y3B2_CLOSI|nr:hypothetical protein CLF_100375 [Clonorchis sinensis]